MLQIEKFYVSPTDLKVLEPSNKSEFDFIFKEIFQYQIYNNISEMKIKNGDVVLDVGAHIGIYSRYAACHGASRIISIEMEPKHFSCLKLNVRPEDDIFNCVMFDKLFTKFKLENGLFKQIDFLKINISGKEQSLIKSFSKKLFNVINKISMKAFNLNNRDKQNFIDLMKLNGFNNSFNITLPNCDFELLYFWK